MAYTINIGKNKSELNRVIKDIEVKTTLTGVLLKEDTSEVDPVLIVSTTEDLSDCNYLWGNMFNNRRYFIKDIVAVANNRYEIHCHCDVLTTYYMQYKSCKCLVNRSKNLYNWYIEDPVVEFSTLKEIGTLGHNQVGNSNTKYILVTTGRGNV